MNDQALYNAWEQIYYGLRETMRSFDSDLLCHLANHVEGNTAIVETAIDELSERGIEALGAGQKTTGAVENIATNEGTVEPLDECAIDDLCERLNCGG